MGANFDQINKLCVNREAIRLKVKVTRMWTLPMYNNPSQTASVEMILLDQFGGKFQASIKKPLLYKFAAAVEEGAIYKMLYFSVMPNTGNYRGTAHDFKLNFLFKTTVVKIEDDSIPDFGFTFVPFNEIERFGENHEFHIGTSSEDAYARLQTSIEAIQAEQAQLRQANQHMERMVQAIYNWHISQGHFPPLEWISSSTGKPWNVPHPRMLLLHFFQLLQVPWPGHGTCHGHGT